MQWFSLTTITILALTTSATAGHIHHEHASSYTSVVQHNDAHHHDSHGHEKHDAYDDAVGDYGDDKHHEVQHEPHHYPKYSFDYGVKDAHTGDHKSQWEHRDGDHVKGAYTLAEADGTTRVVEYSSDGHSGFNAIVKRIGHAHHPQVKHDEHGHGGSY